MAMCSDMAAEIPPPPFAAIPIPDKALLAAGMIYC
jgi:hypothetical protein